MKKLLALLFFIISFSAYATTSHQFYFDGIKTNQETFNATGIFVDGDKAQQLIIVNNSVARYYVILPYSEKWVFNYEEGQLKENAEF